MAGYWATLAMNLKEAESVHDYPTSLLSNIVNDL
jgi:hypothetical protein